MSGSLNRCRALKYHQKTHNIFLLIYLAFFVTKSGCLTLLRIWQARPRETVVGSQKVLLLGVKALPVKFPTSELHCFVCGVSRVLRQAPAKPTTTAVKIDCLLESVQRFKCDAACKLLGFPVFQICLAS